MLRTVLTNSEKAARSLSFGSEQAARPHTLTREVSDLRDDVEAAVVRLEGRDSQPEIGAYSGKIGVTDGGTTSLILYGRNFLAGRAQASVLLNTGLTITAIRPGTAGNALSIEVEVGDELDVAEADGVVTVTLADGDNTASDVADAINAASVLVTASAAVGAPALNAAIEAKSLAGGTGEGLSVFGYLHSAAPVSLALKSVSNTAITLEENQLLGSAGQIAGIVVESHTARSNVLHITVVA